MRLVIRLFGRDLFELSTDPDIEDGDYGFDGMLAGTGAPDLTIAARPFGFAALEPNDEPCQWE